jgi:hypothetical protein
LIELGALEVVLVLGGGSCIEDGMGFVDFCACLSQMRWQRKLPVCVGQVAIVADVMVMLQLMWW